MIFAPSNAPLQQAETIWRRGVIAAPSLFCLEVGRKKTEAQNFTVMPL
jgi:hypothetical protein